MLSSLRGHCFLLAIVLVLWSGSGSLDGLPGKEQKKPRMDQYGDPLPEGAIARLGTLRLVHLGRLASVAVSPDGKIVASGVSEGNEIYLGEKLIHKSGLGTGIRVTQATVRLWDVASGKLIRVIGTPDAPVSTLYFEPGGRTLFAGCGRFLCSFDVATGRKLWEQEAFQAAGLFEYVQAEKLLLTKDKLVSIHNGRLICPVPWNGGTAYHYHQQKAIRIWNSKTGKPVSLASALESSLHSEALVPRMIHEVVFSPSGQSAALLISQAEPKPREKDHFEDKWKYTDRRLQIVDLETGKVQRTIADEKATMRNLTFSEDGQMLAFAMENTIWLMQPAGGRKKLLARDLPSSIAQLAFFQKNQLAVLFGDDSIRAWDISAGKPVERPPIRKHFFEGARSGRVAASIHHNTVRLVDADSGKPMHSFEGHRLTPAVRFAIHSKETLLSRDGEKALWWDASSWKTRKTRRLPGENSRYWSRWGDPDTMDDAVSVEKRLYVKENKKGLELCDLTNDRIIRPLQAKNNSWSYFSAAGNRLITHEDKFFHFHEVGTGVSISKIPRSGAMWLGYNSPPTFTTHGNYFVKNEHHSHIDVFSVNTGNILRKLVPTFQKKEGRGGSVLRFHVSGDEEIVVGETHEQLHFENGVSQERVGLTMWSLHSGKIIQEMVLWPEVSVFWRQMLSRSEIHCLALSNDYRLVAFTERHGKTIEIWETASGTKRGELIGHDGTVADLAFSSDDRQLASSSEDTTVLVWDMNRPLQPAQFNKRLSQEELAGRWQTLFQPDAKKADTAIWSLVTAAQDSLPFLKTRLRPDARPDPAHVQKLLTALDSDNFKIRSMAEADLESLGELVLDNLKAAAKQKNSLEKQRRLELLLRKAQKDALPFGTSRRIGQWRALEILERIGTPEATQLVAELADGASGTQLTKAARAVLVRVQSLAPQNRRN